MTKTIQGDLTRIVGGGEAAQRLGTPADRVAMPVRSSLSSQSAAAGGGISSPLTEPDYTKREWHDPVLVATTDGVFSLEIKRLKTLAMTDSAQRVVTLKFADKPVPPP